MYGLVALLERHRLAKDDSVWKPKLGLDLEGGTRITLQAKATDGQGHPDKLRQARTIIDQRVNATGVTEAEVTTQGGNQVIIEIPGEDESDIVDQVGSTAQLRFRLVWASTERRAEAGRPGGGQEAERGHRQGRLVEAHAGSADPGRDAGRQVAAEGVHPAALNALQTSRPRASSAPKKTFRRRTAPTCRSSRVTPRPARS